MVTKKGKVTGKSKVPEPEWASEKPAAGKSGTALAPTVNSTSFDVSAFKSFMSDRYNKIMDSNVSKLSVNFDSQKPLAPSENDIFQSIQTLLLQKSKSSSAGDLTVSHTASQSESSSPSPQQSSNSSKPTAMKAAWGPEGRAADSLSKMRERLKAK